MGGIVAGALALVVAWFTVADRVDNHWLTTDKANAHMRDDERNAAWTLFAIADLKASAARNWMRACKRDVKANCSDEELQAQQTANEAADLKKQASQSGKGKP